MRHLTRTLRYATLGATALIVGTCWLTPLAAETESGQPSLKEILEKRSKTLDRAERAAPVFRTIRWVAERRGRASAASSPRRRIAIMFKPPNTWISVTCRRV